MLVRLASALASSKQLLLFLQTFIYYSDRCSLLVELHGYYIPFRHSFLYEKDCCEAIRFASR
jgi:hypothetical protein